MTFELPPLSGILGNFLPDLSSLQLVCSGWEPAWLSYGSTGLAALVKARVQIRP